MAPSGSPHTLLSAQKSSGMSSNPTTSCGSNSRQRGFCAQVAPTRHLLNFRAKSREIFLGHPEQGAEPFIVEYQADGIALIVMTEGKANSSDSRSGSLHRSSLYLRPKRPPCD